MSSGSDAAADAWARRRIAVPVDAGTSGGDAAGVPGDAETAGGESWMICTHTRVRGPTLTSWLQRLTSA